MRTTARHHSIRTSLAGAVVGLVGLVSFGLTSTSAAAAPDGDATPVQVEAVSSDEPVMVEDLKISAEAARTTYYCAVRDGTFGCKNAKPGSGLVVARLYQHKNFGGFQVVIFNPKYRVGCTSGTGDNEGGANLGKTLSNRVSSVKTYNHCDVKLFNGNNKSGARTGFIHRDNLLAFNDRANSFRIS